MSDTISRQAAIDARRYIFGNDEFSLEAAYHDCKMVFDGITDDDSFQEADTGLILYYANEIIYALQEALEGKNTNTPSSCLEIPNNSTLQPTCDNIATDTISRQAAVDVVEFGITYAKVIDVNTGEERCLFKEGNDALKKAVERLKELPSVELERHLTCKNCIHLGHAYMMPCKNCKRNQMLPDWYEVEIERKEE